MPSHPSSWAIIMCYASTYIPLVALHNGLPPWPLWSAFALRLPLRLSILHWRTEDSTCFNLPLGDILCHSMITKDLQRHPPFCPYSSRKLVPIAKELSLARCLPFWWPFREADVFSLRKLKVYWWSESPLFPSCIVPFGRCASDILYLSMMPKHQQI